jgi:hypothetical protein
MLHIKSVYRYFGNRMYKEKGKTLGPLITNNIDRFSAPVIYSLLGGQQHTKDFLGYNRIFSNIYRNSVERELCVHTYLVVLLLIIVRESRSVKKYTRQQLLLCVGQSMIRSSRDTESKYTKPQWPYRSSRESNLCG